MKEVLQMDSHGEKRILVKAPVAEINNFFPANI